MHHYGKYSYWFRHLLYPLYNRLAGREVFAMLARRQESQWLSRDAIEDLQLAKLREVLANAGRRVPFYRIRFQEIGFDPAGLGSLEEFRSLPLLVSKQDIQDNREAFVADGCDERDLLWHRTGGSTGEPLEFATDRITEAASAAAFTRALGWWGIELGARHVMFWGSPRFIVRTPLDRLRKYSLGLRHRLMNRRFFPNYNLNQENMAAYREVIERFQPEYVRGMPSSLFLFARYLVEEGKVLDRGRPVMVHSACEQLYGWEQNMIEKGFGAPVANTYGLSEFGEIAFEAPCRKLHLMDEDVLTELVPGPGEENEIVVTQLNNTLTPLIRYRTGDIAERIASGCDCGRGLRVLEGLKGRAHDFIVAPDGRFVHGQFFTHLLVFEPGIRRYQVVQEQTDLFRLLLVVSQQYSRESERRIVNGARGYLGEAARFEFEYVDSIPLTPAGKHLWIISRVSRRRSGADSIEDSGE